MIMVLPVKKYFNQVMLLFACLFFCRQIVAHPMPSAIVQLTLFENFVQGEAKIPLIELQNAIGDKAINTINYPFFKSYFTQHLAAFYTAGKWLTNIDSIVLKATQDAVVGKYEEVLVYFSLSPPKGQKVSTFTLKYDAVIHQVVTHKILVYTQNSYQKNTVHNNTFNQIGIIELDIPSGKIFPLLIKVEQQFWWEILGNAMQLGMAHIKEGTDHLLFIVVLILPSMLVAKQKKWGAFGGTMFSLVRLIKIISAFTITHSISLILASFNFIHIPSKPIEIAIAISILISALHALSPIFFKNENYVAAIFGLIHGFAFASALVDVHLSSSNLLLNIIGFNLGIEIMQLFVITIIFPWFLLLSKTPYYFFCRVLLSILSTIAAIAWLFERISGNENFISKAAANINLYAIWYILILAIIAIVTYCIAASTFSLNKK